MSLLSKLPRPMADLFRGSADTATFRGVEDAVALGVVTEAQAVEVLRRVAFRAFEASHPVAAATVLEVANG
jgi:hypothetical protein